MPLVLVAISLKFHFILCSVLEMSSIPTYSVPPEVWKSEETKEPLPLNFVTNLYRKTQNHYLKAYKTMVHLEEAAQTLFMKTFDQTSVRIFYTGLGRLFFILNEVSDALCKICFNMYSSVNIVLAFIGSNG